MIVSPGLRGEPERDGEGFYRARWMVAVALDRLGQDRAAHAPALPDLVRRRGAALPPADALLEAEPRPSTGATRATTTCPFEDGRSLSAAQLFFDVDVPDVAVGGTAAATGRRRSTRRPTTALAAAWPVEVEVHKIPITEELA